MSTTLAAGGDVILTAVSFTAAAMRGEGETTPSMRLAVTMHAILILPGLAWPLRFAYAVLTAVVGAESVAGVSPLAASPVETVTSGLALGVLGLSGAVALREAVRARSRVL